MTKTRLKVVNREKFIRIGKLKIVNRELDELKEKSDRERRDNFDEQVQLKS